MSAGLLAVWMQIPAELDEEFNAWYNEEHVPERMGVPGFLAARRYTGVGDDCRYMAHYDLESVDVLHREPYASISAKPTAWTRRILSKLRENVRSEYELVQSIGDASPEPAPYALLVRLGTAPEDEAELDSWYTQDHLPALQSVPGCYRARRFRAVSGTPRNLAIYDLASPDVPDSDAWHKAADSPWTLRMRPKFTVRARDLGRLILSRG